MTLHLPRPSAHNVRRSWHWVAVRHVVARYERKIRHNQRATYYVLNGRALRWYQIGL
jgi:hypothetical protein